MFNSIEEQINVLNGIMEECVIDGGDAGGAYLVNAEGVAREVNLWLNKMELTDKYKIITEERKFEDCKDLFRIFPKIVSIDYDITHPEYDEIKEIKNWDF